LYAAAKAGNISAIIFWLKTRAHWREGTPTEAQVADTQAPRVDADPDSQVLLVLPDNSRDPALSQVLRNAQEDYFARRLRGPGFGKSDPIVRSSGEEQVVPTEFAVDTDSARNLFPREDGQKASGPGA
jgi:hypothetical protein